MKTFYLTICCILIFTLGFTQNKTSFGLRGGANISNISNANFDTKTNIYFGAFMNIHFSDLYELQPEIIYSNQGGKDVFNNNKTVYIEYISLGVANKFFVTNSKSFHFTITPSIDFDIDDTLVGLANRNDGEGNDATFIDIAFSFGLGYEFKNGLTLEARYKMGSIDVYSGSFHSFSSQQLEDERQFNRVFQAGISYKFNFTKKED